MLLATLLASASDYTKAVLETDAQTTLAFRLGVPTRRVRQTFLRAPTTAEALRYARDAWAHLRASGIEVPAPTGYLDSGMQGGYAFRTVDPDVVVRVGLHAIGNWREDLFCEPDEAIASGVVRTFGCWVGPGEGRATWKERVDTNVEGFLLRRYDASEPVIGALVGLYGASARNLAILRRYPETRGLARAIRYGLPTDDIDLHSNIGVTKDGRIVAYDL